MPMAQVVHRARGMKRLTSGSAGQTLRSQEAEGAEAEALFLISLSQVGFLCIIIIITIINKCARMKIRRTVGPTCTRMILLFC